MRIAYFFNWNVSSIGVVKKVVGQVRAWSQAGVNARVFVITNHNDVYQQMEQALQGTGVAAQQYPFKRHSRLLFGVCGEKQMIQDIVNWRPDLIYARQSLFYPALAHLARLFPLVLEVNTDDLSEYRLSHPLRYWCHRLTRGVLLKSSKGLVYVASDLSRLPYYTRFNKPGITVANGVDLTDYPVLKPEASAIPKLVFMGTPSLKWHGIDKILRLALLRPKWEFHLIGPSSNNDQSFPKNLVMHGYLDRVSYEPILAHARVAIGTLALHRNKMDEASPLKTREYLAYGLPVIIGYRDTDFPEQKPYILQLPNTADNIDSNLPQIDEFVLTWRNQRVDRNEILHLDVRYKEKERLRFFERVLLGT